MGKEKKSIYQYSEDGKFLQQYESQTEVLNKYKMTKGNLFGQGKYAKNYRKLNDNTYISPERLGRDKIRLIVRIDNCPFCNIQYKNSKKVEVYNLLGEKIAEFKNPTVLEKLTGKDTTTTLHRATRHSETTKDNLIYKYKN